MRINGYMVPAPWDKNVTLTIMNGSIIRAFITQDHGAPIYIPKDGEIIAPVIDDFIPSWESDG